MASVAQHLGVALAINERIFHFEKEDLKEFLIGSIVCDAPAIKKDSNKKDIKKEEVVNFPNTTRKPGRKYSHFLPGSIVPENQDKFISPEITIENGYRPVDDRAEAPVDYKQFCPMINYFLNKYDDKLDEPFMLGYLTHLITDDIYFGKIVPTIVNNNMDSIEQFISEKYGKYNYRKKANVLTNGEYLEWSHQALYKIFDDYTYLSMFEPSEAFPTLQELGEYYKNWENSNRNFKPSMIKDLNGEEAIEKFLLNSKSISSLINDAQEQFKKGNIIKREGLTFKGLWPYDLYLNLIDMTEEDLKTTLNIKDSIKK